MKKIISMLITLLPVAVFAQSSQQNFYDKYAGREGFTTVTISPKMFELVASIDEDDQDLSIIKQITGVQVLTCENEDGKNTERAAQLTREAYATIGSGYEELLSVKEEGTDLKILARAAGNGIVSDLLIVGNDDGDFVYVKISGTLDLKKLKDLDGKVDIEGFDYLDDIDTGNK